MASAERQPDATQAAGHEQTQPEGAAVSGPVAGPVWGPVAAAPALSPALALRLQGSAGNAAVTAMLARQGGPAAAPAAPPAPAAVSAPTPPRAAAAGPDQEVDPALSFIADYARRVPGYTLLTRAIGSDPITGLQVDGSAGAIVREIATLVPGGAEMLQRIEQSGALDRAGAWLQQEIPTLGLSYERISQLFQTAWDSISAWDLFDPSAAWDRLVHIFQGPVDRLIAFAERASEKLLEFALEAMLATSGGAAEQVMAILRRAGQAFTAIVRDPIGFARNLVNAVMSGFQGFLRNIGTHLQRGLIGWLTGALGGTLRLPERLDFEGIISLVTQVLGLTWERIRERLVRMIGARRVAWLERSIDFVRDLVTRGPAAAWERILEFASGLADQVLDGIREWITESVVGAAIRRLVTMFNPAGAIINAVIAIYDTIQFVIERARQIGEFITSVADSIAEIASGALGRAADAVEGALGRAVPLAIGFLADLIGLGDVGERVRGIIERIRETIDGAIDRLMEWIVARFSGRGRQAEADEGGATQAATAPAAPGQEGPEGDAVEGAPGPEGPHAHAQVVRPFSMHGAEHELKVLFEPRVAVRMASTHEDEIVDKVTAAKERLAELGGGTIPAAARDQVRALDLIASTAQLLTAAAERAAEGHQTSEQRLPELVARLSQAITDYGEQFDAQDLSGHDPLGDVESTRRFAQAAADEARLRPIDLAVVRAKIEDILGEAWGTYASRSGVRVFALTEEALVEVYGEERGRTIARHPDSPLHGSGMYDRSQNALFVRTGRSIAEVAGTMVHELTHALQRNQGERMVKYHREFQAHSVQREFLRRLGPEAVAQLPEPDRQLVRAADDDELRDLLVRRYGREILTPQGRVAWEGLEQDEQVEFIMSAVERKYGNVPTH